MTVVPYVPPNDNDPFPRPRYQATRYKNEGLVLEAVVPGQSPMRVVWPRTMKSKVKMSDCRAFAMLIALCVHERRIVADGGLVSFHFYPAEPPPFPGDSRD